MPSDHSQFANAKASAKAPLEQTVARHMAAVYGLMAIGAAAMATASWWLHQTDIDDGLWPVLQDHAGFVILLLAQLGFAEAVLPRVAVLRNVTCILFLIESVIVNTLIFVPLTLLVFGIYPTMPLALAAVLFTLLMLFSLVMGKAPHRVQGFTLTALAGVIFMTFGQLYIAPLVGVQSDLQAQLTLGTLVTFLVAGFCAWDNLVIQSFNTSVSAQSIGCRGALRGALRLSLDHLNLAIDLPKFVSTGLMDLAGVRRHGLPDKQRRH